MRPETQLTIMAAFTEFLLKTSLGFCICWAMSKIVAFPRRKFLIWFGFLISAGCYWLWLTAVLVPHGSPPIPLELPAASAMTAPIGKWQIQHSWEFPISIVLRGLGALYLIVLTYFLLAYIKKHLHLRWILRFTYRAPDAIENIFRPIAESLDAGHVQLLMLSGIHSPATFGWIRPTILLPPFCLEQDESELRDIFRHELQHVQRRDFVFNTIASLCRALVFFHPAVWYAKRKLELESELACDLAVVSDSPDRRASYAECLVRFARLHVTQAPTPWNLDFAGSSVQLKVRVRSILAGNRTIPGWLLGLRATLGLALLAVFLGVVPSLFVVLSYEQPRIAQPGTSQSLTTRVGVPLRRKRTDTVRLHGQVLGTHRVFYSSPSTVSTAPPVEAAMDVTPIVERNSDPLISSEPQPTLKQRSDLDGTTASHPARASVILLSSPSSSHSGNSVITRGRSIASAITAVASEGVRIASHGSVRGDH
ncbi:MAG TPA: M56 family metallopeptidase [Acidobacteriaceae bacterium]|nr:M56 family metallopeptidase [Terriglobia bacterium]HVC89911.1 M56 family metallopeptidase [Acidobacteriaceae bacterium]